jgi:hypothetical protein
MSNKVERHRCQRTPRTLAVEALLRDGRYSIAAIAEAMGMSRQRIDRIKGRMDRDERVLIVKTLKAKAGG